jgi:hypothetical protein
MPGQEYLLARHVARSPVEVILGSDRLSTINPETRRFPCPAPSWSQLGAHFLDTERRDDLLHFAIERTLV